MIQPERKTIRVLIVDDHALVRAGLRMLIESRPGMRVVDEASTPSEALEIARREPLDVILLDVYLGEYNGLDLIAALRDATATSRVLIVTAARDLAVHSRAIRLCAMGLVLKDQAGDVLLKAIEKVYEGEAWFDRSVLGSALLDMLRGGGGEQDSGEELAEALTAREREIVALLCEGIRNKEIARRLVIKESTVSHHLTNIFDKLGVSDRLELALFAFRHRLAAPPTQTRHTGVPMGFS